MERNPWYLDVLGVRFWKVHVYPFLKATHFETGIVPPKVVDQFHIGRGIGNPGKLAQKDQILCTQALLDFYFCCPEKLGSSIPY